MGLTPFHIGEVRQHVTNVDFIFNTVPQLILTAEVIAQMPQSAFILDLASKPGGTDFRYAERRGIKALLAPGLPGIVAPKTAGQIMAQTLSRLIAEQTISRGNQHG